MGCTDAKVAITLAQRALRPRAALTLTQTVRNTSNRRRRRQGRFEDLRSAVQLDVGHACRWERSYLQPQVRGVQPQPEPEAGAVECVLVPLSVCAAKTENWSVERLLPHFGHSGLPLPERVRRSYRLSHS
jgi:hypothetical protein